MRGDGERELVAGEQYSDSFFIRKFEMVLELSQRGVPVLELTFPVVPEFRRGAGPIARSKRDELFSILLSLAKSEHFNVVDGKVKVVNKRVNGVEALPGKNSHKGHNGSQRKKHDAPL